MALLGERRAIEPPPPLVQVAARTAVEDGVHRPEPGVEVGLSTAAGS